LDYFILWIYFSEIWCDYLETPPNSSTGYGQSSPAASLLSDAHPGRQEGSYAIVRSS
jgi:hypothetical protein